LLILSCKYICYDYFIIIASSFIFLKFYASIWESNLNLKQNSNNQRMRVRIGQSPYLALTDLKGYNRV